MFDIALRPLKDLIFDPLCAQVPRSVTPLHLTAAAFVAGIGSCATAAVGSPFWATVLWGLNRSLDCLDGAVARHRGESSDLGGFFDLLGDFTIYSAIPVCCAIALPPPPDDTTLWRTWLAVAIVESTFHINNFVLFFIAAVTEKRKATELAANSNTKSALNSVTKELTSLTMRPALVEGTESGLIFTLMLAIPKLTETLCWVMIAGVLFGTAQRVVWLSAALAENGEKRPLTQK